MHLTFFDTELPWMVYDVYIITMPRLGRCALYTKCMTKYVALLRGIAPGNPAMRNNNLRSVLERLGFQGVKTVISSGNVLFESTEQDAAKLEAIIEAAWPKQLGFTSTTIIRSLDELKEFIASQPFDGYEHGQATSLNVTFLKHAPSQLVHVEGRGFSVASEYAREICVIVDTTAAKTPNYMTKAERAFGKEITTRTWKTVERIVRAFES